MISLLFRLQFAVLLVRLIYLTCLALLRPKCPIFGPNFASMMFPALQALDVIAVPITSCSHPCCAQTGPLHPVNSGCLVLYILCLFFFVSLLSLCHLCFCLMQRPFSVHAQLRHAVTHHSAFFLQQRFNASMLFLPLVFPAASRKTICALLLLF